MVNKTKQFLLCVLGVYAAFFIFLGVSTDFARYQPLFVDAANDPILSWTFGLNRLPAPVLKELEGHRIVKITSGSIAWKDGVFIHVVAFTSPRFSESLLAIAIKLIHTAIATTTDFFPTAGNAQVGLADTTSWATVRGASSGTNGMSHTYMYAAGEQYSTGNWQIIRIFTPFDTSGIGGGQTISSATYNLYQDVADDNCTGSDHYAVIQTTQADSSTVANTDYPSVGTTEGATRIVPVDDQYNVWTLNATGIGFIQPNGTTFLGLRIDTDIDNTNPAVARHYCDFYSSRQAGTTQDPFLEVVYAATPIVSTLNDDDWFTWFFGLFKPF